MNEQKLIKLKQLLKKQDFIYQTVEKFSINFKFSFN